MPMHKGKSHGKMGKMPPKKMPVKPMPMMRKGAK